ncbi:hypothetical protein [Ferruginibacter sp.]
MKTIFTLLLLFITTISVNAQNTDKEEYLTARTVRRGLNNSYVLYVDYSTAQGKDYLDPTDPVYDSTGHTVKFRSESAALNYLAKQSWAIVTVIPITSQGSFTETKYIFRRKITGDQPLPLVKPTAE